MILAKAKKKKKKTGFIVLKLEYFADKEKCIFKPEF